MSLLTTAALQRDLAAVGARLRAVTVVVRAGLTGGHGSGIVWDANGLIVTNAHVATCDRLAVELADGRRAEARLVARDPRRDLAVLRTDPFGTPAVALGDPSALRPGQLVVALGHPLGVPHALAVGVVHARRGALIHTDVRLAPGNSGGPLADAEGRVVGVNAMIARGLGVAVSVDEVRALLGERFGAARRAA